MARKLTGRSFNDTELRKKDLKTKKGIIGKSHGTDTLSASKEAQMGINDKKIAKGTKGIAKRVSQIRDTGGKSGKYAYGTTEKAVTEDKKNRTSSSKTKLAKSSTSKKTTTQKKKVGSPTKKATVKKK